MDRVGRIADQGNALTDIGAGVTACQGKRLALADSLNFAQTLLKGLREFGRKGAIVE